MTLDIHTQTVPKLRMNVAITSLLHMLSWRNIGTTFTFTWFILVSLYHLLPAVFLITHLSCFSMLDKKYVHSSNGDTLESGKSEGRL